MWKGNEVMHALNIAWPIIGTQETRVLMYSRQIVATRACHIPSSHRIMGTFFLFPPVYLIVQSPGARVFQTASRVM